MSSADHRSVDVIALGGVIQLTYCSAVAISIDLDDIDARLDHALQRGSRLGAIWLISLWGIDAVQSDSSAIHQDDCVSVSDSIDTTVSRASADLFVWTDGGRGITIIFYYYYIYQ